MTKYILALCMLGVGIYMSVRGADGSSAWLVGAILLAWMPKK